MDFVSGYDTFKSPALSIGDIHKRAPAAFATTPFSTTPHADRRTPEEVDQARLSLRFEQDLQLTWDAWGEIIRHLGPDAHSALHPRLISPRACWMAEPPVPPESPALGIF